MEAVQNATKHAGSHARVTITLGRDRERVRFAVADDGVGMDPSAADGDGDGLTSMRDRIGAVSGELEITSAPGRGTTIRATVPDSGVQEAIDPFPIAARRDAPTPPGSGADGPGTGANRS